jgi:tetratricopeptide (TPR) repeat protein
MAMMEIVPLSARLLVAAKALAAYLWKMLVPLNLVPYYPYPTPEEVTLSSPEYLLPVLIVPVVTVVSLAFAQRLKLLPALWVYYVVTLIPVLGLVQVGDQAMADRYSYLPGIAPFLLSGLAVAWLLGKYPVEKLGLSFKVPAIVVCLLVIGFLSYRSVLQISIWENGITLWSYVIAREPGRVSMAYINRGVVLMDKGDMEKAGDDFERAIAINPLAYKAHNNRGLVFLAMKQYDRALDAFSEALAINPSYVDAYFNRGLAFTAAGKPDDAIEAFNRAIVLGPSDGDAYYRRGLVFLATEEYDKAIEDFNRAIALNSSSFLVYTNLGVAYGKTGRDDEALQALNKSISLNPDNPAAYNNRAFTYYRIGRYEEALNDLAKLIQLDQKDAPSYINRGNLYLSMGRKELAVADFRKACDLGNAEACSLLKR